MKGNSDLPVTQLLRNWRQGDETARDRLIPLVYRYLRQLAQHELRKEREGHTLEPRDLVHEVYIRLVDIEVDWHDRSHFFAVAARTMRRILVDHARAKNTRKRGDGKTLLSLDDAYPGGEPGPPNGAATSVDVLLVDDALSRLGKVDERMERVVELSFFGGMTQQEISFALDISPATVFRDLRFAKAWLRKHLSEQ